ncbi:MAG: hypothetical protein AAFX93_08330 [Verrucomicrobiota bacterium]
MSRYHYILKIAVLAFAFTSVSPSLWATYRTITNQDGVSIQVELIELKEVEGSDYIVFKRRNIAQPYQISLETLSEDDQKFLRNWWEEKQRLKELLSADIDLEIEVKNNRKRSTSHNDSYSQDRDYFYRPTVTITNDDFYRTFKDNTVRIVYFAEHTRYRGTLEVVSVTEKDIDFPKNSSVVVEGNRYSFSNYESDYSNYEYGWEEAGYIIIIKNSQNEITHIKSSMPAYERRLDVVLNCDKGEYYTADLSEERESYYRR